VDWLRDNMVLVAGLLLVALVVIGVILVVLRGLALWRTVREAQAEVEPRMAQIDAGVVQFEQGIQRIEQHQVALNDAVKRLDEQATELRLVTMRLFAAVNALRAPLRYLGR